MHAIGYGIGKILKKFRLSIIDRWPAWAELKEKDLDGCFWVHDDYEATLKKLAAHPHFKGNKTKADAYLCGYYRGIRDAYVTLTAKN